MTMVISLLCLLIPFIYIQLKFVHHRRKLLSRSWEAILGRVERVDIAGIQSIAECYLQPDKYQVRIEPAEMWEIVGGLEGVAKLRENAAAMLDLAVYAERWNGVDGPIVSEMIRRDAVRLKQAVTRIQIAYVYQFGSVGAPFHLQEAAASYYLIRRRLLGLYEGSKINLMPQLQAAL